MSKTSAVPPSVSRTLPLIVALVALFIWASVAHAQTELQTYESGSGPVAAAPTSGGGGEAGGASEMSPVPAGNAASTSGETLGLSFLPSTGGPLLPLIGLGVVMLGATGLLASLRYSHR